MKAIKTEHGGAKNGGGFWGRRVEAKQTSKKLRRRADKAATFVDLRPVNLFDAVRARREV